MNIKLGVIMDPISSIHVKKDSTLAILLAAQKRGWPLFYMEQHDIFVEKNQVMATMRSLKVHDDEAHWYDLGPVIAAPLSSLSTIMMRKDPPVDSRYLYTAQLLAQAEKSGVRVVNSPRSLMHFNEKLSTLNFPPLIPPTLITADLEHLSLFLKQQKEIILKPLHGMGGYSVFYVRDNDPNTRVIFETMTQHGTQLTVAQRYLPEIVKGDKRILMIDGHPISHALARIPAVGDIRGNLAAGAKGVAVPLNDRDRFICETIGPWLRENGILFAGLDVIGDHLTEINITSPTCIRELEAQTNLKIADQVIDMIETLSSGKIASA